MTRRLRSWSARLERGWSREVTGTGKFVSVEEVVSVKMEAPGPDSTLNRRARAVTTTSGVTDGEPGHRQLSLQACVMRALFLGG